MLANIPFIPPPLGGPINAVFTPANVVVSLTASFSVKLTFYLLETLGFQIRHDFLIS